MSWKIGKLSLSDYKAFYTGNRKRRIVATLSVAQFVISIALLMATFTVRKQVQLIEEGGKAYHNLIETGSWSADNAYLLPFSRELRALPSVQTVALTGAPVLNSYLTQIVIKNADGSETYYPKLQFMGGADYFDAFDIELLQGIPPSAALERYASPAYINEAFAGALVPRGEDPVGKDLSLYDPTYSAPDAPATYIVGVVRNFYTNSLEEEVFPCVIYIKPETENQYRFAYIRLGGGNRTETLAQIRTIWEKYNPGKYFTFEDVDSLFAGRNSKAFELSHLLLLYSLISIFLTCFGLFGMALYAAEQRTKEIGIRKVNGASALQIMLLLCRQFVARIALAFVIALPLAWLFLNRWLESYAYRVEIRWPSFLLAGLLVLLITLLTVGWHSYKAASANPVKALKSE
jgi:hypothetical protein